MQRTTPWRRLTGGLAGLTVALGGTLAVVPPAQAQDVPEAQVAFVDSCDLTHVVFVSELDTQWLIRTSGGVFWPQAGDEQPGPGEVASVNVPAELGAIRVTYQGATGEWPKEHTWTYPGGECDLLDDPIVTQPTCDGPGSIVIPGFGDLYRLDGEPVEAGSTHEVAPGTHTLTLTARYRLDLLFAGLEGELLVVGKEWLIEIAEPDCPEDGGGDGGQPGDGGDGDGDQPEDGGDGGQPEDGQGDGPADGEDAGGPDEGTADGEGGELAKTGTPAALLSGAALVLLTLGGVLYLAGRQARVAGCR
jgi:hypothetical protein